MKHLTTLLLLIFSSAIIAQTEVSQILLNHYKLTKTNNILKEITSFEANITLLRNDANITIKMKAKMPDLLRSDIQINDLKFVKIFKDGKAIQHNPYVDSISIVENSESPLEDFITDWLALINTSQNSNIQLVGTRKIEDIATYQIQLDTKNTSKTYFIDKLSYLIIRMDEEGGKTSFFQDYRQLDKYIVPFKIIIYDENKLSLKMKLSDIKLNGDIPNSIFAL